MRTRHIVIGVISVLALAGLVGAFLESQKSGKDSANISLPAHPTWTEVSWPFPMDQWGKGKAFVCKAADCGTEVKVYVRAKIGFCNCTTGVADDEELDRISDFDLVGGKVLALGPGRPISVAWMKGRSRAFGTPDAKRGASLLTVGFNDRCDAIVAMALIGHSQPGILEPAVLEFLNSKTVLRWAEVTLGL